MSKLDRKFHDEELKRLQTELVKLQRHVMANDLKLLVLFEGRDAAGKGGVIKRIRERLNARGLRVVALTTPTDLEKSQWYFQRYVEHLPAAGEIVLFDRSWYNRAGVERVMGFATDEEVEEFLRTAPDFERMIADSGIVIVKYWFSIGPEEQEKRFQKRIKDPMRRWKISPMDLEARGKWSEYSKAKDEMLARTDHARAPWRVVPADDKRRARLNCIAHLLTVIPYDEPEDADIELPPQQVDESYVRPPLEEQSFVPQIY